MSEFTKLGGYLVEGQPEVAHDSALSGNGLPESPLGISEQFITDVVRPNTQSAMNLNIGHPETNAVAQVGATIGYNNNANNTGFAVGTEASAYNKSIAVGDNVYANQNAIAVGRGVKADQIAAFGTYNSEDSTAHDYIFVVGNGTNSANRSDAFKIDKDGRVVANNFVTPNNVQLSALTGVLKETGFGYDSNNKISGYNGSAIASIPFDVYGISASANIELVEEDNTLWISGKDWSTELSDKQDVSAMTAYQLTGDYISAYGLNQSIRGTGSNTGYYVKFQNPDGANRPAIVINGSQGSAFYKENQLKLTRDGKIISFNIGAAGATITADAAATTGDGGIWLCNTSNSAYYNQNGIKLYNSANTAQTAMISYDQVNNWNGYNDKITAMSAAIGDVPEGVMVESGLEYNAVNEISGYNGSAIAQYGAEKQFLTHDDTIVHVSNSAQYAFGVNLSGISADLARMMGVDETVLWETQNSAYVSAVSLSEPASSFNKLRFYYADVYGNIDGLVKETVLDAGFQIATSNRSRILLDAPFTYTGNNGTRLSRSTQYKLYAADKLSAEFNHMISFTGTSGVSLQYADGTDGSRGVLLYKILGIGRKS